MILAAIGYKELQNFLTSNGNRNLRASVVFFVVVFPVVSSFVKWGGGWVVGDNSIFSNPIEKGHRLVFSPLVDPLLCKDFVN